MEDQITNGFEPFTTLICPNWMEFFPNYIYFLLDPLRYEMKCENGTSIWYRDSDYQIEKTQTK